MLNIFDMLINEDIRLVLYITSLKFYRITLYDFSIILNKIYGFMEYDSWFCKGIPSKKDAGLGKPYYSSIFARYSSQISSAGLLLPKLWYKLSERALRTSRHCGMEALLTPSSICETKALISSFFSA